MMQADGTKGKKSCKESQFFQRESTKDAADAEPPSIICEHGQMFERGIYDRSRAVFAYFDLPFDAEPPT